MIVSPDPSVPITTEQWAQLRDRWPHAERIVVAMRLARDLETCTALLRGEPVNPDRIDPAGLRWATERMLVCLDLRAIDLLLVEGS